ncbi:hypothetical protein H4R26_002504 [Coemansia thaxteri]|uniref:DSBA-like thioredoxin domain-containing protein n=1 Tax=Coemansia thaxteri TaxID=2663907 RepID=A0A9W8BIN5_9FUNG|nr:hypothetical protein H4R26_002504 [Coemansia thaxteri]
MSDSRIVFYFDCASAFSYIGFEFMEKYKALWGVSVDYRPIVLSRVMSNASNSFSPYKLPHLLQDLKRTSLITGIPFNGVPANYAYDPTVALRTLQFIKTHLPDDKLTQAMRRLWHMEYVDRRAPESTDDIKYALADIIDTNIVDEALGAADTLDALSANIEDVKHRRGFGAPTILVYKSGGATQPQVFFGSDRFEHIAFYLGKEFHTMKQLFANPRI